MADDRRDGAPDRRGGTPGPGPGGVERRGGHDRHGGRPAAGRRDDVVGSGRTALSAEAALRARDVDHPTAADLARAEAELTIVRRNWTPPPT